VKLALLIYRYFPYGGQQRNMLAIASAALARGHQVAVICHQWQGEVPDGIEVSQVAVKGFANHSRMADFGVAALAAARQWRAQFTLGFIKLPGVDLYYAADPCFAEKACHQRGPLYRLLPRTRGYLRLERAVFAPASNTHILEVSERERASFMRHYGTPEERFHRLIPGISRTRLAPSDHLQVRTAKRRELGIDADAQVLIALGSGFKTKGLDRSIRTLAVLRERGHPAQLLVAGQDKESAFRTLARRLGVAEQVHFLGGRDDIPALLQAADLLIHPAYRENTGNALLEAMIAGLPVVATQTCGYSHFVHEADMGEVIADDADPRAIADAVARLLQTFGAEWQRRGKLFADNADIYDRPAQCVAIIESLATARAQ